MSVMLVRPGDTMSYTCPQCPFTLTFRVKAEFYAPMFLDPTTCSPMLRHILRAHITDY